MKTRDVGRVALSLIGAPGTTRSDLDQSIAAPIQKTILPGGFQGPPSDVKEPLASSQSVPVD